MPKYGVNCTICLQTREIEADDYDEAEDLAIDQVQRELDEKILDLSICEIVACEELSFD